MNDKEYISLREYAEAKGISIQAVYKQLNRGLKKYVISVDGQKKLLIEALDEVYNRVDNPLYNRVDNELDNQNAKRINDIKTELTEEIKAFCKEQITEKDKQIATLLSQIEQLQTQNANLTEIIKGHQVLLAMNTANKKEKKGIFRLFQKNDTTEQE